VVRFQGFKLKYLGPYVDRLLRLAADATLREELTAFPLSRTADDAIQPEHRLGKQSPHTFTGEKLLKRHAWVCPDAWDLKPGHADQHSQYQWLHHIGKQWCTGLTAVLVRLLWPKMRKRSGRLGGKGAPGSARAAILNFLTGLEPPELRPLLVLFLNPFSAGLPASCGGSRQSAAANAVGKRNAAGDGNGRSAAVAADALFAEPWWAAELGRRDGGWWLAAADAGALAALPARSRVGFLNAAADLLRHLVRGTAACL
jgi:U3 small nucleolar RNA-associated protein 20